jgi:hypothetical protein
MGLSRLQGCPHRHPEQKDETMLLALLEAEAGLRFTLNATSHEVVAHVEIDIPMFKTVKLSRMDFGLMESE